MIRGKRIGNSIYVHRLYVGDTIIPASLYGKALKFFHHHYPSLSWLNDWDFVKYNKATTAFTFSKCFDFDREAEPTILEQIRVIPEQGVGNFKMLATTKIMQKQANPFIIHGKHLFVGEDYPNFDWKAAKARFESYQGIGLDKNRMGRKDWWVKNYLDKS